MGRMMAASAISQDDRQAENGQRVPAEALPHVVPVSGAGAHQLLSLSVVRAGDEHLVGQLGIGIGIGKIQCHNAPSSHLLSFTRGSMIASRMSEIRLQMMTNTPKKMTMPIIMV